MTIIIDDIDFWHTKDGRRFEGYEGLPAETWFTDDFPDSWTSADTAHDWLTNHSKGSDTEGVDLHWRIWDTASNQFIGHAHAA